MTQDKRVSRTDHHAKRRCHALRFACASLVLLAAAQHSLSQDRIPINQRAPQPSSSTFLPENTASLIEFHNFERAAHLIQQSNIHRLLEPFGDRDFHGSDALSDWLIRDLGSAGQRLGQRIGDGYLGIAFESNPSMNAGAWVGHVADLGPEGLDFVFPRSSRDVEKQVGDARFIKTNDGVIVSLRDGLFVAGKVERVESLMRSVMKLMTEPSEGSLEEQLYYRSLFNQLPKRPIITHFINATLHETDQSNSLRADGNALSGFRYLAWALYERRERIDVAVRAILHKPRLLPPLDKPTVDQILALPQTTLFAWATSLDFEQLSSSLSKSASGAPAPSLLPWLSDLASPKKSEPPLTTGLGPNLIAVWDQHLNTERARLEFALLIDCDNPSAFCDRMIRVLVKLVSVARALGGTSSENEPTVEITHHFGEKIYKVPFLEETRSSRLPLVRMLAHCTPSCAAVDNWFVFALSENHIQRIVEARKSLIPSLASLRHVRSSLPFRIRSDSIAIAQPELAADELEQWLVEYAAGKDSLLAPRWWRPAGTANSSYTSRWGTGVRARQEPGVVVVAKVYDDSAASGKLVVGDKILAVDGKVLDIEHPNRDLRTRLTTSSLSPGPVVRVLRDDQVLEIALPANEDSNQDRSTWPDPHDLAQRTADVAKNFKVGTFSVRYSGGRHYVAHITLVRNASGAND